MPELRYRPFILADAMVLVAASTPGLILLRIAVGFGLFTSDPKQKTPWGREFLEHLSVGGGCILLSVTIAVLILSVLRPQPTLRDVVGGPGVVACLAVMLATVLPLAGFAVAAMDSHGFVENLVVPYNNMFGGMVHFAGPMIGGAWLALILVGQWRLRPSWTDRLGCVVGGSWVLIDLYLNLYFIGVLPLLRWWAR